MVDLSEGLLIDTSWLTSPLRHVAITLNSNVDKKFKSGEIPVRLCNYVDVYRRPIIGPDVPFMNATATNAEVERFRIRIGDVVITKDSESWLDIGVPTLVAYEAQDLLCGYHLCILRPDRSKMTGSYLARVLTVPGIVSQLHVRAKGVTRYGLSQSAIKAALIPVPPIEMQKVINRYLDHAELRIARAIQAKAKVVRLFRESRSAMISELVLGASSDGVDLKNSGIPGIGEVPSHWRLLKAKYVWDAKDVRSKTGDEERLSVSSFSGIVPRSSKNVTMFEAKSYIGHKIVEPGDLVINSLWAWATGLGVSHHNGIVSPVYGVYGLRPEAQSELTYLDYILRSNALQWQFQVQSKGIWKSRLQLSDDAFFRIVLPLPPLDEQVSIANSISRRTSGLDAAIDAAEREIDLLREYRTRLIADVVTGKKDVRAEAANLPDVDPLELARVLSGASVIEDDVEEEVSADAD